MARAWKLEISPGSVLALNRPRMTFSECLMPVTGWNFSHTVKKTAATISHSTIRGTPPKTGISAKTIAERTSATGPTTDSTSSSISGI